MGRHTDVRGAQPLLQYADAEEDERQPPAGMYHPFVRDAWHENRFFKSKTTEELIMPMVRLISVRVVPQEAKNAEQIWKESCAPLMIQQPGCLSEKLLRSADDRENSFPIRSGRINKASMFTESVKLTKK